MTAVLAWHFVAANRRLLDGQPLRKRRWYRLPPGVQPVMCERGYHASRRAIDALAYAPGPIVCRVELRGSILEDRKKLVASERRVLWYADATRTLHEFALWCARRALLAERRAGREPDPRSWEALRVKRRWLDGRATDEEVATAQNAAWAAAVAAADAAWAVRSAADAAALAAADAVWAVRSAGRATDDELEAAQNAAWDAALAAVDAVLAVRSAAWAAEAAACAPAWDAADAAGAAAADRELAAQNRKLTRMLEALAP